MGLAIAHQVREQVVFPPETIEVVPKTHFKIEQEQPRQDWGDVITIV
jgi:hypothetical protein